MYNPLEPWNTWLALSSQAARVCWATQAGMLRGIAQGSAKAEAETDRMVMQNVGVGEAQILASARKSNKKHRVAKKASAVAAKRNRCNRHRPSGQENPKAPAVRRAAPNRSKKPDEQILISFSEILFVSRAVETTKGGCALSS
jgi:hypothetical protein